MNEGNAMDENAIRTAVHDVVLAIVRERSPECAKLSDSDALTTDLGLRSLDLARIVALLEMRLDGDPFAELVSITTVRTVGDIADAYRRLLAGEQPSNNSASLGADRGERRRALREGR